MFDNQIFGLRDGATGQNFYGAVMGAGGRVFGLAVYRGELGLGGMNKVSSGEINPDSTDALVVQDAILLDFDKKGSLAKEDKALLDSLGISLKGHALLPAFRSHKPGYVPWFLTADEVRQMTLALDRAIHFAPLVRDGDVFFETPPKDCVPVYHPADGGWDLRWTETALKGSRIVIELDELMLKRLHNSLPQSEATWVGEVAWLPTSILEGERPYYPRLSLFMDKESQLILQQDTFGPEKPSEVLLLDEFLRALVSSSSRPAKLVVRRPKDAEAIQTALKLLGVKLEVRKRLPFIDPILDRMIEGV